MRCRVGLWDTCGDQTTQKAVDLGHVMKRLYRRVVRVEEQALLYYPDQHLTMPSVSANADAALDGPARDSTHARLHTK